MSFPTYFETFDPKQLLADYPVGQAFVDRYTRMSRDELHALQNERFIKLMTVVGLTEVSRTGIAAMSRGSEAM